MYGTFAVFKVGDHWWQMDHDAKARAAAEVKKVFRSMLTRSSLTRIYCGVPEKVDFLIRMHTKDIVGNQNALLDLMGTALGKDLKNTETFKGITKALNYIPSFPDDLKAAMKRPPPEGTPYAVVVPMRKDAERWLMPQEAEPP